MRSVLLCQHDASLVQEVMPRWLHSFTDVAGIVVIRDKQSHRWKKLKRSVKQDGLWGTLDLLAYRMFHRFRYAAADRQFESQIRQSLSEKYPPLPQTPPILETTTPNGEDVQEFLRQCQPDVMLACCKHILKPSVFEKARLGTFVMHPGICPEYRNAHGCFWALVNRDLERVGMTLLKIDRGIDTGPVYGYFKAPYREATESHLTIQRRMTYGNLDGVRQVLENLESGTVPVISTAGRTSNVWGQPTLTSYLRWKQAAKNTILPPPVESKRLDRSEDRSQATESPRSGTPVATLPPSTR